MKRTKTKQQPATLPGTEQMYDRRRFIHQVAREAVRDWKERYICLPSIVIALAAEGSCFGKGTDDREKNCLFPRRYDGVLQHRDLGEAVRSHNDYLFTWKNPGQQTPNWEKLIGQKYYILAVQYLQDAQYPYGKEADFEERIVGIIEQYDLSEYDD